MRIYTFRTIIEPDENNTFHGYVPSLPGCHTWGETIEETKINLKDAIKCHIQGLLKDKEFIPQDKESLEFIQTFTEKELVKAM
ncbi:type II toxin-antitoxin system HicB family antitoxin [Candidatus Parcubacteria bacterium]|nr:type II toxin-antitoxin system HicB family antitoxin [Candidatus Parcubacteria bacterium]